MSFHTDERGSASNCGVYRPYQHELGKVPGQFNDYINGVSNRFCEICNLYLDGLSMDDICYLRPEDLIDLIPRDQHRHRLLMTIMVRRYLYRLDPKDTVHCPSLPSDCYDSKSSDSCESNKKHRKHNDNHNDNHHNHDRDKHNRHNEKRKERNDRSDISSDISSISKYCDTCSSSTYDSTFSSRDNKS